jgi:uncharacterized protein (TIRG00374 family)
VKTPKQESPATRGSWLIRNSSKFIGIILILVVIRYVDIAKVVSLIAHLKLGWLIAALPIHLIITLIKSYRWQKILFKQRITYKLKVLFAIYLVSFTFGLISPGRLGDFVKVLYLKQDGYPFSKSVFSSLMDRIYDVVFLLLIGFLSLLAFISLFRYQTGVLLGCLFLIGGLILVIYWQRKYLEKFLRRVFDEKYILWLKTFISELKLETKQLDRANIILCSMLTLIAWSIYFLQGYMISRSLDVNISFVSVVACMSIASILNLLPISILGIGTRDVVFISIFAILSINYEQAVAFSTLFLLFFVFNGIVGVLMWWFKPIQLSLFFPRLSSFLSGQKND